MTRLLFLYLFLIGLLVLSGCEKEAENITLPKADPKLVAYSYLSPSDSLIEVEVSKSVPFFGNKKGENENKVVEDAFVQLESNGITVLLPFDNQTGRYSIRNDADFPILAGQTYQLNITSPGGFSCSARTTVPSITPQEIRVAIDSTIRNSDGFEEIQFRIISRWNDVIGITNYYQYSVRASYGSGNSGNQGFSICNNVFTDEGKNGAEIAKTCTYLSFYNSNSSSDLSLSGEVYLLTTDAAYYKFHESYYRYDDENPFAEPVKIYTNIEGGLGCFGSYLEQKMPLRK